jgi:hypothetical protein
MFSLIAHLLGALLRFPGDDSIQAVDYRRTRPVHRLLFAGAALPLVIFALLLWRVGHGWMHPGQLVRACREFAPVCGLYSLVLFGSGLVLRRRRRRYIEERRLSKEFGTFTAPLDF